MPELARYRPDAASIGVMPEWLRPHHGITCLQKYTNFEIYWKNRLYINWWPGTYVFGVNTLESIKEHL